MWTSILECIPAVRSGTRFVHDLTLLTLNSRAFKDEPHIHWLNLRRAETLHDEALLQIKLLTIYTLHLVDQVLFAHPVRV